MSRKHVLLMSGGIGDYLHYLSRLPAYLEQQGVRANALLAFVESTVPHRVRDIFESTFPEVQFEFVPAAMHWTRTNPLLDVQSEYDRVNRPAYAYVRSLGHERVTDWFLPFLCSSYAVDSAVLSKLAHGRSVPEDPYVVISMRDKGFGWWPERALCRSIERMLSPRYRTVYLGTPDERPEWLAELTLLPSSGDALALSHGAALFIGTDTGLATVRELTGRPNLYCINEYWLKELMVRFHYIEAGNGSSARSRFAFDSAQLLEYLREYLEKVPEDARPPERSTAKGSGTRALGAAGSVDEPHAIYARPRDVFDVRSCYFYHTTELPGYPTQEGEWDLRDSVDAYLGGVQLEGKRVLEVGTASGFLCFHMERRGAEVVACDLSPQDSWDLVPYAGAELALDAFDSERRDVIRRLNDAFWFSHRVLRSQARVVHGSAYDFSQAIGPVDISTFCSVLRHLRDPFRALARALAITRERVVVTEMVPKAERKGSPHTGQPIAYFLPNAAKQDPMETWWDLTPELVVRLLAVLGFPHASVTFHEQRCRFHSEPLPMFTVVANREIGESSEKRA